MDLDDRVFNHILNICESESEIFRVFTGSTPWGIPEISENGRFNLRKKSLEYLLILRVAEVRELLSKYSN